jgi:hypothetical protein
MEECESHDSIHSEKYHLEELHILILFLNPLTNMKKSILMTSAIAGTIGLMAAVGTYAASGTSTTSTNTTGKNISGK